MDAWAGMTIRVWHDGTGLGAGWAFGMTAAEADGAGDRPRGRTAAAGSPAWNASSDHELLRACLDGHAEAFDVIVERHRRTVYRVCYRFVANHEDASDLSQEVFLRAYRALGRFRGDASLSTWLYRIAVNVCLNRASVKGPRTEPMDGGMDVDSGAEPPSEGLLRAERAARVRAAVARLPDKQRAALILRVYEEMTHQQIAEALGTSVGAAKANVFHALRGLKRLLGGEVP